MVVTKISNRQVYIDFTSFDRNPEVAKSMGRYFEATLFCGHRAWYHEDTETKTIIHQKQQKATKQKGPRI